MLTGKRVLIVEEEFLIALDIQRVLEAAHAAETTFARTVCEVETTPPSLGRFDLAIINVPEADPEANTFARALIEAGVALVISSAESTYRQGVPDFPGVPVVSKPFAEEQLLTACALALATAPPQD